MKVFPAPCVSLIHINICFCGDRSNFCSFTRHKFRQGGISYSTLPLWCINVDGTNSRTYIWHYKMSKKSGIESEFNENDSKQCMGRHGEAWGGSPSDGEAEKINFFNSDRNGLKLWYIRGIHAGSMGFKFGEVSSSRYWERVDTSDGEASPSDGESENKLVQFWPELSKNFTHSRIICKEYGNELWWCMGHGIRE